MPPIRTIRLNPNALPGGLALFRPHPLLNSAHAQSAWATLFPRLSDPRFEATGAFVAIPLPDGDALTGMLHLQGCQVPAHQPKHPHPGPAPKPIKQAPTLVLLHGLEGSHESHYVVGMAHKAWAKGWNVLRLNYRGCAGPADLAREVYHGLALGDIDAALRWLEESGHGPLLLAGISMGAHLSLSLLAAYGGHLPNSPPSSQNHPAPGPHPKVLACVAIGPPLDFVAGSGALNAYENLGYNLYFMRSLHAKLKAQMLAFPADAKVVARAEAGLGAWRLSGFDAAVTAPAAGLGSAQEYYEAAGAGPRLAAIQTPTLLIHAVDDPIIPWKAWEAFWPAMEANECLHAIVTPKGGHVGFMEFPRPGHDGFWGEDLALAWLGDRVFEASGGVAQGPVQEMPAGGAGLLH